MPTVEIAEPLLIFIFQVLWEEQGKEVLLEPQWVGMVTLAQVCLRDMCYQTQSDPMTLQSAFPVSPSSTHACCLSGKAKHMALFPLVI